MEEHVESIAAVNWVYSKSNFIATIVCLKLLIEVSVGLSDLLVVIVLTLVSNFHGEFLIRVRGYDLVIVYN